MSKELLLTTENGFKGPHKITVGSREPPEGEIGWSRYGWSTSRNFGKMTPQEIEGFPIVDLYDSYYTGAPGTITLNFAQNSNVNFEGIRVTRMDNQDSWFIPNSYEGSYMLMGNGLFSKMDVGKTIELIFEAT